MMKSLDIVIPVHNEKENIYRLYEQIKKLELKGFNYRIIFVDDGSTDNTLEEIKKINATDKSVECIKFSRNFGHQIALSAGVDCSNADCVITMDGDLQHPPRYIPEMLSQYGQGYDIVQMVKKTQGRKNPLITIPSFIFYRFFSKLAAVPLSPNTSDFRLISKKAADVITELPEQERFIRGIVRWIGFKYTELEYGVEDRKYGKSKYGFSNLTRLALHGVFGHSNFPLKLSFYVGLIISILSFGFGIYSIANKLTSPEDIPIGYTDVIVMISFLGGLNLLFLGIIGAYISKVFDQVKGRPLYIIEYHIK